LKPIADISAVDAACPDAAVIARAAEIIRTGGLVVFPTLGLYGLGADPFNPAAVRRIFEIKGRQTAKALLVLIADLNDLGRVAMPPNAMARDLMRRFWPGRVTFVLSARQDLPVALTGNSGNIGVRLVAHPVAAALVRAAAAPLTGTSANISGAGGCPTVQEIDADLLKGVDLVLDAGPLAGGPGSTVVDVTGQTPLILREGAVASATIMEAFKFGF
jgi:L-threonylcarbamoyladenylate synthase